MNIKKISILGMGYIGLPTSIMLSSKKHKVSGFDINLEKINKINKGEIPFVEKGLRKDLKKVLSSGYFKATNILETSDIYVIAVPTPFKKNLKKIPKPDLSYVKSACNSISKVLKKNDLVILESTSPVGTTIKVSKWLSQKRKDLIFPHEGKNKLDVNIAYCPERVLPGNVMKELKENDRVIGGVTTDCSLKAKKFYKIFCKGKCSITNSNTAEMVKLTENSFRDSQVAFANEISMISDNLGVNVTELIKLSNLHPRVNILNPGPGVGGHCIAVDPWFLISSDRKNAKILKLSRQVNIEKEKWVVDKVKKKIKGLNKKPKVNIAILGLSFKADIDDLRESPAVRIVQALKLLKHNIKCVEPNIKSHKEFQIVSLEDSIKNADIILCLVKHKEFIRKVKMIDSSKAQLIDICGLSKD